MITTEQIVSILDKHSFSVEVGDVSVNMVGKSKFSEAAEEIRDLIKADSEKKEPKY